MVAKKKAIAKKQSAVHDEKPPKRSSRFAWIALGVFIVLCVTLAFFFTRPAKDYTYNNFPFTKEKCPGTDEYCYFAELKINNQLYTIQFYHHPTEVESILFEYSALEALREARTKQNATVIIGVPDGAPGQLGIAGSELGRVLGKRYGILEFEVVPMIVGSGSDRVDCDDARTNVVVMAFQQGTEDAVSVPSPNCIVLTSTSPDRTIAVADAFVYRLFGIIRTVRNVAPTTSSPSVNTSNVTR